MKNDFNGGFSDAVTKVEPWIYPAIFPAILNGLHASKDMAPSDIAVVAVTAGGTAVTTAIVSTEMYNNIVGDGTEELQQSGWKKFGRKFVPAILAASACFAAVDEVKAMLSSDIGMVSGPIEASIGVLNEPHPTMTLRPG